MFKTFRTEANLFQRFYYRIDPDERNFTLANYN